MTPKLNQIKFWLRRQSRASGRLVHCKWLFIACTILFAGMTGNGYATDVNSQDYVPAPAGTNVFAFYSQYTTSDEYKSTLGHTITHNTGIDVYVNTLRYVHYFEVLGFAGDLQVLVPVGTLYNAKIAGASLDAAAGIGDPILATGLWLLNDPAAGRYFGLVQYLFVPIGQYERGESLNLGENRWKYDLQAGLYQDLGNNFAFQVTGDVVWYGANDSAGNGWQRLTQDNTYQLQAWLSYAFAPTWSVAAGYSRYWGGDEYLNGVATGNATHKDQLRLELSKFITPTFQVLGLVQRDFNTEGGFPENFRGTVRLLQVF
ncbi:transporter [Xanthobacter autotrophicus]|uniref:transporter n=1 Tax=Xanthobacter autotrophicus TaxID=280 RepID=UPI003727DA0C